MKRDITILAIGDRVDFDSFKKLEREKNTFIKRGFEYKSTSYGKFFNGKLPVIETSKVIVFLFFPFYYWDKYIEHKDYRGIYGSRTFYSKFLRCCELIENIIDDSLFDKEILYINEPKLCGVYRDKLILKKKFHDAGISQPVLHNFSSVKEIEKYLNSGKALFLKPHCGSMGKGITYLSWSGWHTNFIFKNSRIISKRADYGWKFIDVTGNRGFVSQLIKKDILIEDAVDPPILDSSKVDLRIYTFFDKIVYIYPRRNSLDKITTNISQGGVGDPELLKILPKRLIENAKKEALKVTKTLGLGFAGIDIMPGRNLKDVYVLDVNTFSGFPRRKTFNLAKYMCQELVRLHNEKKLRFTSKACLVPK